MFVVAEHLFIFILFDVTATAEIKAEAEGGICREDGRRVGSCGRGLVEASKGWTMREIVVCKAGDFRVHGDAR